METTIVICSDLQDFNSWLFIYIGYVHRSRTRRVVINNRRYIAVSQPEHMCGYRCDTVSFTASGRERENFNQLFNVATICCLAQPKKPFKFGR